MLTISNLISGTKKLRKNLNVAQNARGVKKTYNMRLKKLLYTCQFTGETELGTHVPQISFLDIGFVKKKDAAHPIPFKAPSGYLYLSQSISAKTKVQVRCNCSDYRFTWFMWNKEKGSHYGRGFPPYERVTDTRPERNPVHSPGICKHLMGLLTVLRDKGVLV